MTAAEAEADPRADVTPEIEDVMALSPLQEGLYSLTALAEFTEGEPADDPYVIGMAADIYGNLDVGLRALTAPLLRRALIEAYANGTKIAGLAKAVRQFAYAFRGSA